MIEKDITTNYLVSDVVPEQCIKHNIQFMALGKAYFTITFILWLCSISVIYNSQRLLNLINLNTKLMLFLL